MEQQVEQQVQQHLQQVTQAAVQQVSTQALAAGVANAFISIPQPLPGQPRQIFLRINNQFRVLNNPNDVTFDEVQEAFQGPIQHQVVGVWDTGSPQILRSIRIQRV